MEVFHFFQFVDSIRFHDGFYVFMCFFQNIDIRSRILGALQVALLVIQKIPMVPVVFQELAEASDAAEALESI